jgi:tellurite resistance protein TerC
VVLLVIEGTDLVFAIDSIPAVLGILPPNMEIGEKRFIAFTSNIFAILGLRSMYFALAGFIHYFRFLKPALAFILCFIGIKMILPWAASIGQPVGQFASWVPSFMVSEGRMHVPTNISLAVIGCVLALAMLLSLALPKKQ